MANRRTPSNRLRERARRDSTAFLSLVPSTRFILSVAFILRVEPDAVRSTAWIVAYRISIEGHVLAQSGPIWRQRVFNAVRKSAEHIPWTHQDFDDNDETLLVDNLTPESILLAQSSLTNKSPRKDDEWQSEAIFAAKALAGRMRISVRHARRFLARWRQQDEMRGEDV